MSLPPFVDLGFADSASRTHYILKELRKFGLTGRKVDFLYDSMKTSFPRILNPTLGT